MFKYILNFPTENIKGNTFSRSNPRSSDGECMITVLAEMSQTTSSLEASECLVGSLCAHVNCVTLDIDWSIQEPSAPLMSEPESR